MQLIRLPSSFLLGILAICLLLSIEQACAIRLSNKLVHGRSLSDGGIDIDRRASGPVNTAQSEASSTSIPNVSSAAPSTSPTAQASSNTPSTPVAPTSLPRPFDSSLGDNFTQPTCQNFFINNLINNKSLQNCVPFSLLLQNSRAMFEASMSDTTLTPLLDASCSVSFDSCKTLMSSLATQITATSVCGQDYALSNPLVVQAYYGLLSYEPMYRAACLKADPSGKSDGNNFPYCYVSALNSSSQADSQMYYLPLNLVLPTGNSVSCSSCVQQTMGIFSQSAPEATLSKDYVPAANIINNACGPNFVKATTAQPSKSGTKSSGSHQLAPKLQLLALTGLLTFVGFNVT